MNEMPCTVAAVMAALTVVCALYIELSYYLGPRGLSVYHMDRSIMWFHSQIRPSLITSKPDSDGENVRVSVSEISG